MTALADLLLRPETASPLGFELDQRQRFTFHELCAKAGGAVHRDIEKKSGES